MLNLPLFLMHDLAIRIEAGDRASLIVLKCNSFADSLQECRECHVSITKEKTQLELQKDETQKTDM